MTGRRHTAETLPVVGPSPERDGAGVAHIGVPRLARHTIELSDGHRVGIAVCGRGVPLVVVHGFSAEGFLYAQTLTRLVAMGFKVVAIDTAGHGGTQGLPTGGATLTAYAELLGRAVDELGIRRAVLAGHSMGGRLVADLAAMEPDRAVAVLLLDAAVGDAWDRRVNLFRVAPPLLWATGAVLVADTLVTFPVFRDPVQAGKLARLVAPTVVGHLRRPWRLAGPAISILRSRGSGWALDRIAAAGIPLFVIHGEYDLATPVATARDAARRGRGDLVVVRRAGHSWLLRDPQTLPAIVGELLAGPRGVAIRSDALRGEGLDPDSATLDEVESAFFEPDAPVLELTPPPVVVHPSRFRSRPRYRWTMEPADGRSATPGPHAATH